VTAASLIDEAVTWGIRRRAASQVVTETLDQVLAAIPVTPGDARVLAVIREQAERISRADMLRAVLNLASDQATKMLVLCQSRYLSPGNWAWSGSKIVSRNGGRP
jgi:hypothetical protein